MSKGRIRLYICTFATKLYFYFIYFYTCLTYTYQKSYLIILNLRTLSVCIIYLSYQHKKRYYGFNDLNFCKFRKFYNPNIIVNINNNDIF